MEGNKPLEVKEGVLAAIRAGEAKMKPKWRFTLKTALSIMAVVIVLLILIYLASFIMFTLYESGVWFVPTFGVAGWYVLFGTLPWLLIMLSGIFIILLALLVRKYPFAYTRPLIYSFLGILFLIAAGSFLIVRTSLESALFPSGGNEELPFIGGLYSGFGVPDVQDVHHGEVVEITPTGFVMEDFRNRTFTIVLASNTTLREGTPLSPGDGVVVFGEFVSSGTVNAEGVEQLGL